MANALLNDLYKLGFKAGVEGERLWISPEGRITPVFRDRIRANKEALIALLRKEGGDRPLRPNTLVNGDCTDVLKRIPDNSIDLVVTDPPYGLGFQNINWDKALPPVHVWGQCARILKPGSFAFIMATPRQDLLSRMILMLEFAGLMTGFTSLYWTYANGFPKARNIGQAVDTRLGAERQVLFEKPMPNMKGGNYGQGKRSYEKTPVSYTLPETKEAKNLEGSYGGFQPKPAVEVILVVMKPLDQKSYTEQAMSNGKGITWLDNCRIPYPSDEPPRKEKGFAKEIKERVPANLLVSDGVLQNDDERYGGYSRYFSLDAWADLNLAGLPEMVLKNLPYLIVPKASKKEKEAGMSYGLSSGLTNNHPSVKPIKLMAYLITMGSREGEIILDPFCGSGTTCVAAHALGRKFIGIEKEDKYMQIAEARIKNMVLDSSAKAKIIKSLK